MADASYALEQVTSEMKSKMSEQHVNGMKADITDVCFNSCTKTHNLKEDCVKKCTQLYISTWNTMSQSVIPELKRASGIQ